MPPPAATLPLVTDETLTMQDAEAPRPQVVAATLHAELVRRNATLATAESVTGGALGSLLTAAPGASDTYLGGVVTYATALKRSLLGIGDDTVSADGVVSARCAVEMAAGVRRLCKADYAISTTGVAGPSQQEDKPVGLVYVAVAGPDGVTTRELHLTGDRAAIRESAVLEAMSAAIAAITEADR